jgi:hypothetical protein
VSLEHSDLSIRQQRLRKRLGWCVFMRDQILALGMRRPAHIQLSMQHFSSGIAVLKSLGDNYASAELAVHFLESTIDVSSIQINRVTRMLHHLPQSESKSLPRSTRPPNACLSPRGEKRRSSSPFYPTSSKKQPSQCPTPIAKGHPWPEWSLWLEGDPLEPGVMDPSLSQFWGSCRELPRDLQAKSGGFRPVSEDLDFFSTDICEVSSDFERDVLEWEAELGNSRSSTKSTNPGLEITSLLDSDSPLIASIPDFEGISPLIFGHRDRFDEPVN